MSVLCFVIIINAINVNFYADFNSISHPILTQLLYNPCWNVKTRL